MTTAEIQAEITSQKEIAALCTAQIKTLILQKAGYSTNTSQTQISVTNQRIAALRAEYKEAIQEIARLEALLGTGGGTTQIRPYS